MTGSLALYCPAINLFVHDADRWTSTAAQRYRIRPSSTASAHCTRYSASTTWGWLESRPSRIRDRYVPFSFEHQIERRQVSGACIRCGFATADSFDHGYRLRAATKQVYRGNLALDLLQPRAAERLTVASACRPRIASAFAEFATSPGRPRPCNTTDAACCLNLSLNYLSLLGCGALLRVCSAP
ncbi:hypothetical protein DSL92_08220 [Billgrantia gudaonensis]|uniref:Uncharacterized protein n=1 Tax=Billgrantia gudaonensis TaxID=376427 RepID=A0A3S0QRC4_9GAMM|nr:hypothetical protein DSL92_08220 [Halomonas gudaonensis]